MKRIQKQAIKHYDNMYNYAITQPKNNCPDDFLMEKAVNESWFVDNCSYCQKYNPKSQPNKCGECPLHLGVYKNPFACCNGLWIKMDNAQTWETWIKYNRLIRKFIEVHG